MARVEKVTEELRREVSNIIHGELKDPRLGFVTVTGAQLSKDLRFAKIYFSVLGKEEEHIKTKEALQSATGFIRRLIAQRLGMRFVPEIVFKEDRSGEYSMHIEKVLNEIKKLNGLRSSCDKLAERKVRKEKQRRRESKKSN